MTGPDAAIRGSLMFLSVLFARGALIGVSNMASGPDWQQSAKRLAGDRILFPNCWNLKRPFEKRISA